MKKLTYLISSLTLVALVGLAFINPNPEVTTLKIGQTAPKMDVKMKDISTNSFSLSELKKENGLLVIFSCNTCPFVVGTSSKEGWEKRYNGIYDLAAENNIGMVLVNSNEAFRKEVDSFNEMVSHAENLGYKAPYVVDENHLLADAFGARTTPHVFLFDADSKLVYSGAIDDNNADSRAVKAHYLKDAISNLSQGKTIDPAETKALGCSIKRVLK